MVFWGGGSCIFVELKPYIVECTNNDNDDHLNENIPRDKLGPLSEATYRFICVHFCESIVSQFPLYFSESAHILSKVQSRCVWYIQTVYGIGLSNILQYTQRKYIQIYTSNAFYGQTTKYRNVPRIVLLRVRKLRFQCFSPLNGKMSNAILKPIFFQPSSSINFFL